MYHASEQTRSMTKVVGAAARPSLIGRLGALRSHLAAWAAIAAANYKAAALYEKLSALSDAELRNRGLSRDALAWDLSQASDRTNARIRQTVGYWHPNF